MGNVSALQPPSSPVRFLASSWLDLFASVYRRFPALPGRVLSAAGFELFNGILRSPFWGGLGQRVAPVHAERVQLLLDLGECHQRFAYLTGRCPDWHVGLWLRSALPTGGVFIDIGANVGWFT